MFEARNGETYAEAISRAAAVMTSAGVDGALRDARLLLCAASGLESSGLISGDNSIIDSLVAHRYSAFIERRINREPLSRILGMRAFWKDEFLIDNHVLDPRPDTEIVIEAALEIFSGRRNEPLGILDLGTGSGAILCSLLREFPAARGLGLDISANACEIARHNVARLGLLDRATIKNADWSAMTSGSWSLIVSNPPYIETGVLSTLDPEVKRWDPPVALDGGTDGLDAYRSLAPLLSSLLAPDGAALLEIGYDQELTAARPLAAAGLIVSSAYRDLGGNPRVLSVRRP